MLSAPLKLYALSSLAEAVAVEVELQLLLLQLIAEAVAVAVQYGKKSLCLRPWLVRRRRSLSELPDQEEEPESLAVKGEPVRSDR